MKFPKPFTIEGEITPKQSIIISIIGFILLMATWYLFTKYGDVKSSTLPSPRQVLLGYRELYEQGLVGNAWFSIKLNVFGYIEAVLISIPLGFAMSLIPGVRALVSKYFDALRFLPLPAVTSIFVSAFGIEILMKVHFLSFGILLYLVPVVVQRIDEIETIHRQTMTTLGASKWQKIRYLYFPYAMSRISDDIRVLVAISWTYIVIVELLNQQGGVGAMIFNSQHQSHANQVYGLVLLIIAFGYAQDLLLKTLDKWLFPFKYDGQRKKSLNLLKYVVQK